MHASDPTHSPKPRRTSMTQAQSSAWLSLPAPIRVIFNQFPIITYNDNELPQRTSKSRSAHTLYIFTLPREKLSPNPACLKWQIYLMINKISFTTSSSNNHASPTGALPFILPAVKSKRDPLPQAIPSAKIQRWAETQGARQEETNLRLEAYTSLIDQNIRNVWLYHLYLCPKNFESIAKELYVKKVSSNILVQSTLAHQLRAAAQDQLSRTWSVIDAEEVYGQAESAFAALSTLLGQEDFFSKSNTPSLFDASLFAYTHLILEFSNTKDQDAFHWEDRTLQEMLLRYDTLVRHRDRVIEHAMNTDSK